MPYALFSKEAKLSKAYPTEADVWKVAQKSGLVVDVVSSEEDAAGVTVPAQVGSRSDADHTEAKNPESKTTA